MSTTVAGAEVRTYLDGVKAHLDDLPEDDRDELLEDLEEHLLEVAAEDDGTLEQRLGPPAVYAEELRASAGLPSREQLLARRPKRRIAERLAQSGVWRSSVRLGESAQARAAREFLKELQPGWWVLRGYLAVVAPAIITSGGTARENVPFPAISGSHTFGTLLAIIAVVVSVWFGLRTRERGRNRPLSIGFSLAVAAAALGALIGWVGGGYSYAYYEPGSDYTTPGVLNHADGTPIANLCPYSPDGKLLSGVLLFDQNGRPIINTSDSLPDGRLAQPSQPTIPNAYPRGIAAQDELGQLMPVLCPAAIGAPTTPAEPAQPSAIPSPGG